MASGLVVLLGCLSGGGNTWAQDNERDREADMFGGEPESSTLSGEEGRAKGEIDDELGGDLSVRSFDNMTSENSMLDTLAKTDNVLAIGGQLYMRLNYNLTDKMKDASVERHRISSPNLLHLYLDGRPNDRVRGFVRGRMTYDFTMEEGDTDEYGQAMDSKELAMDQLWIKFDIARRVYVTFGAQTIRWGSGRFWNPTDFLNHQRRDPLAVYDERLGVSLLKLHIPIESLGWNFYAIANLDGLSSAGDVGGALRAEILFGNNELSLSMAARKNQPIRLGLDISSGVGDFDFHVEGALVHGEKQTFWRGSFDPASMTLPVGYNRKEDWIVQVSGGSEFSVLYSDQDAIVLGLEYFFNDRAEGDPNLYPWLASQGDFDPLYMGRHYLAAYMGLFQPGNWNNTRFTLSAIENLSDATCVLRLDYQVRLLTYLDLGAFGNLHLGHDGEFHQKFIIPPIPDTPFGEGMSIPAPRLELGLWLMLNI
jgi:hypothetical protein